MATHTIEIKNRYETGGGGGGGGGEVKKRRKKGSEYHKQIS